MYFMGFYNRLNRCHQLLKHNKLLAVTELVYTTSNPPVEVVEYLEGEYPDIKSIESNIEIIKQASVKLISKFTFPESAWTTNYYLQMEIPRLIRKYQGNEIALSIFEGFKNEIDFYRQYSSFYGYKFFVMKKE